MDPRLDTYDWVHIFDGDSGDGCYTRNPADVRTRKVTGTSYTRNDVAKVVALVDGENDDASWVGVFEMTDGKFLTVRAWCDYTGWGCQEGGSSDVADNLEDAVVFGLTTEERARLGF